MDALSPHDPCEEVALIKCAQSGGSASAENWIGYISDLRPGPMLFVQATLKAAWDWAAEKFWPMVDATPRLNPDRGGTIKGMGAARRRRLDETEDQVCRSNGYVLLAGANSAAGLRQRTVRYAVEDDLDQWPDDLDGQGSPEEMVSQRLKVWRRQGLSKRLKISTPTIKGASKIEAAHNASDRRRFYLVCPHCSDRFVPEWGDVRWPDGRPEDAHMVAPCCGAQIEHWQKAAMKLPDGWLSEEIGGEKPPRVLTEEAFQGWRAKMPASRKRGFHLSGIISSFQTWADMATSFVAPRAT
jgi:phage terminase large subunit GpA-like protein